MIINVVVGLSISNCCAQFHTLCFIVSAGHESFNSNSGQLLLGQVSDDCTIIE